jgi:hypothetical protein
LSVKLPDRNNNENTETATVNITVYTASLYLLSDRNKIKNTAGKSFIDIANERNNTLIRAFLF